RYQVGDAVAGKVRGRDRAGHAAGIRGERGDKAKQGTGFQQFQRQGARAAPLPPGGVAVVPGAPLPPTHHPGPPGPNHVAPPRSSGGLASADPARPIQGYPGGPLIRIDTLFEPVFVVATSGLPSPLKSPTATPYGVNRVP